uniref:ABC transporter B family member 11-like n=1 Tax=Rhizophora mucronata TaxID=61149 RepID=A0A2P2MWU7_RHIMU
MSFRASKELYSVFCYSTFIFIASKLTTCYMHLNQCFHHRLGSLYSYYQHL